MFFTQDTDGFYRQRKEVITMNIEELAVIIFEECSSKTRSNKDCVEAIQLRTGYNADIEDTIRRYRQSGSGLEKAAKEVSVAFGWTLVEASKDTTTYDDFCGVPIPTSPLTTNYASNYDRYLAIFNQKGFIDPQSAATICTMLDKKGVTFDVHAIEESECHYRGVDGYIIGESMYVLDNQTSIMEEAISNRAECIANNAWDYAKDEVYDMDVMDRLEYGGYYDGVKDFEIPDDGSTDILIELEK